MSFDLKDKVVLVTGAAGGIGAQVVRVLMEERVKHVAVLDLAEDLGIALQDELNDKYGANKVKFFQCDVTNDDQLFGAFQSVTEDQGYIDVVVNNAGVGCETLSKYKKLIEINVTAVVTSTLKSLELMRKDRGGRGGAVINVSSFTALHPAPYTTIYGSTKAAVLHFSRGIGAPEYYAKTGVRVLAICFGATDTPIIPNADNFDKDLLNDFFTVINKYIHQSTESAARALVEACKHGASASVWLSGEDEPAQDITDIYQKAYGAFAPLIAPKKKASE